MSNVKLIAISDIESEPVLWAWKPYIALGKVTIIIGDGGISKTGLCLTMSADISVGASLGGDSDLTAPENVIFQSAEDSYSDTLRPRLERLGADCSRVLMIDEREQPLSLRDSRLEEAIMQGNVKLCVLDSLQAYCVGSDMHSVNGMRPIMKNLTGIAERTGCAIVTISHLTKKGGKVQYRGLGSVDIYAAARSVLAVGKLPLDENMRAFCQIKNNLAPLGKPQAYGLDGNGIISWLGECEVTVEELIDNKPKTVSQLSKAEKLLKQALANGAVLAVKIEQIADENGISFKTFKRAREIIGAIAFRRDGKWYWDMPIEVVYEDAGQADSGQDCPATALAVIAADTPKTQ